MTRELEPVSVLISRKTQRLYVRQGFEPILEVPVTILDPDRPIGTHIFTAMERTGGGTDLRWSVVSLQSGRSRDGAAEPRGRGPPAPMVRDARADAGRDSQCQDRARPDRHSSGRVGSYRRDSAAVFPDHHGRGIELRDRQGHGFRGAPERRAARRHQEPATRCRRLKSVTPGHASGDRHSGALFRPGEPVPFQFRHWQI